MVRAEAGAGLPMEEVGAEEAMVDESAAAELTAAGGRRGRARGLSSESDGFESDASDERSRTTSAASAASRAS